MDTSAKHNSFIGKTWAALLKLLQEIGLFVLAGFVGAILLLWFFAQLADEVFENEFSKLDSNILLALHRAASPALDLIFGFFTNMGSIAGVFILTAITFGILLWTKHLASGWLILIVVGGGVMLNQVLKFFFQRPRPELWAITGVRPTTFSFPSGHATASLCYFGVLIWLGFRFLKSPLTKTGWTILMVFIIAMVGVSRMYFGVHYPTDVLAGYISGSFWLIAVLSSKSLYTQLRRQTTPAIATENTTYQQENSLRQ